MDLICYLQPGWAPLIRPAPATRAWMDATPESFAYRCLPLNIANAHGWEVLSPCSFDAVWNGGSGTDAVTIATEKDCTPHRAPVSLFGQGILTFHIEGILRTPPGWNLWVGGSPNRQKDGIQPLSGIIETDWSPFTFTMNWRFTRPNHAIRFEASEPICFLFPVERAAIEAFEPKFSPLSADPEIKSQFEAWSRARDTFHRQVERDPPRTPSERWQKHYYRGVDVDGRSHIADHRSKLRLKDFDRSLAPDVPLPPADDAKVGDSPPAISAREAGDVAGLRLALKKREWLIQTLERQRDLAPITAVIERRSGLGREEFLERYYAVNRPVIMEGELADWPALSRWTPQYLKAQVGARRIEFQCDRAADPRFERNMDAHRSEASFDEFMDRILAADGNDIYITAYNAQRNREALKVLDRDAGSLDKFLVRSAPSEGMMWIGPAGTFTPLHHDLTNNLLCQIVGRKRLKIAPPSETGKLSNDHHVYSALGDLEGADAANHPGLDGLRAYDVLLQPGDVLFMPVGWWHQVRSLDFSVTLTYTNFLWRNDAHVSYPAEPQGVR